MKKTLFLFFSSIVLVFAQNKNNYQQFEGKIINISYTQITENQAFCTYEETETLGSIDPFWKIFYADELKKYNPNDTFFIKPIHKYSFDYKQKKVLFIKYRVAKKGEKEVIELKSFYRKSIDKWETYLPTEEKEIQMAYIFKHIKTEVYQKLFSRDLLDNESIINDLRGKVLGKDGFVNFDELYRQLKSIENRAIFKEICD
jgi:hypothetical protein